MDPPAETAAVAQADPGAGEPVDNRVFVLILQHPRERGEPLATAPLACALLRNAKRVVGLSWPNLRQALDRPADPGRWGVLYLGSTRPAALAEERAIVALDRRGLPAPQQEAILRGLDGIVVLDGSWSEAKALWWRNPWLLKLRRLVLNPPVAARYGRIRREPRRAALSTLEAAALALTQIEGRPEIETALLDALASLIGAARPARRQRRRPSR